jgi:hypothetical protein
MVKLYWLPMMKSSCFRPETSRRLMRTRLVGPRCLSNSPTAVHMPAGNPSSSVDNSGRHLAERFASG